MVNYECKICKYKTVYKSHYDRHLNSSRHIIEHKERYPFGCEYCINRYQSSASLSRHTNKCVINALKQTKTEVKEKELIIEDKDKLLKINKMSDNKDIIKYVKHHFADAPPLVKFDTSFVDYNEEDENNYMTSLLIWFNNNSLHLYISELISEQYICADPHKQSIWNVCLKSQNFIIKRSAGQHKQSYWHTLDSVSYIHNNIINPIMSSIKTSVEKMIANLLIIKQINTDTDTITKIDGQCTTLEKLIKYIDTDELKMYVIYEMCKIFRINYVMTPKQIEYKHIDPKIIQRRRNKPIKQNGYTYCVTSPIINGVKIGYWTGSLKGLRSRYITICGRDLVIDYVITSNPRQLEKLCYDTFRKYNISNELFDKRYHKEYIEFIKSNKTPV